MKRIKKLFLLIPVFLIILVNKNIKTIVNVSKNVKDYNAQLTYYPEDHPDVKSAVWYGTIPSSAMNVDSNGWYHYNKDGVNYLVVAAATTYCRDDPNHCGVSASHGGYAQNIQYYNYGDTFELTINGEIYPAMVMDSCGACMWGDRDVYGEKFDIYVPTANSNSGFVNPTGLPASKDGDGPSIKLDPEFQQETSTTPEIPVEPPILPHAELGKTTYSGDLNKGYITGNQTNYDLIFTNKISESEKKKDVSNAIKLVYKHADVVGNGINSSSGRKPGSKAYHADVTYKNGLFDGEIHYFNQGDYESEAYGSYGTIASHGCGPTSMSIVISSLLDEDVSPVETTDWACENGYCSNDGSYHTLICAEANHYGLNCEGGADGYNPYSQADQQELIDKLSSGKYMAVVIAGPGHFTNGGHFFTLGGVDSDNKIKVYDPGSRSKTDKSYSLDQLIDPGYGHVKGFWLISK